MPGDWQLQTRLTRICGAVQRKVPSTYNIAVIVVSHLRKKKGAAIHRTMGSLAFIATARTAWVIGKDPADENKRLLLPIKDNLAVAARGLAYAIESHNGAPVIRWFPDPVNVSADTVFAIGRPVGRPDNERQHAIDWLQERLLKEPRAVRDLKEECDAFGISYHTLRRVFRELGGKAARQGIPPFTRWVWKLPETPETTDQNTGGEFWSPNYIDAIVGELSKPWVPKPAAAVEPRGP
jgi:hypothetical protein